MADPKNYQTIEIPYNNLLERETSNPADTSAKSTVSENTNTQNSASAVTPGGTSTSGASSSNGSVESMPVKSDGAMGDLWIKNFIKSQNWKPKTVGFYIDGQTGYAEFSNVFVSGNIQALTGLIGGFTIGATDLSATDGVNTTKISSGSTAFSAGPTNAPTITITKDGSINASSGTIAGWDIQSNLLRSVASSNSRRIELNKEKNRISIFDAVNEKVAMGYLDGLPKHDGTGNWGVGDYGFWALAGDKLSIDGDGEYVNGDWIIQHDAAYLINDALNRTIVRLGTDSGEKGLFIYNTSGTKLAKYTSDQIFIGEATKYLRYTVLGGLEIAGSITATTGSIGGWVITANDIKDVAGIVGLSSTVTAGDDVRFWAGHATPSSAPFKVTEAGSLIATDATITGVINATSGTLGNITLASGGNIKLGQTAYNTGTGFWLGDDSGTTKLSIGTSTQYIKFDGVDIGYSGSIFHEYTAGETITAGKVVCTKGDTKTYPIKDSAYISSQEPTKNYNGTRDFVSINAGANNGSWDSYFHVNTSLMPNDIQKAVLRLYLYAVTSGSITVRLYRVTSSWTYTTITWGTKPTNEVFAEYQVACQSGSPQYRDFDITNLIRRFKADGSNNGFMISGYSQSDNSRYVAFASETYSIDESWRPSIIITSNESSDGKIYIADDDNTSTDDYNLCRNVIGIAKTSGNAGNTISVYDGVNSIISSLSLTEGLRYYLGGDGSLIHDVNDASHLVYMGLGRTNGLLMRNELPLFIERYPINVDGYGSAKVIPPFESNKCIIRYSYTLYSHYYDGCLTVYRAGSTYDIQKYIGENRTIISASWAANVITIDGSANWKCYFYSK